MFGRRNTKIRIIELYLHNFAHDGFGCVQLSTTYYISTFCSLKCNIFLRFSGNFNPSSHAREKKQLMRFEEVLVAFSGRASNFFTVPPSTFADYVYQLCEIRVFSLLFCILCFFDFLRRADIFMGCCRNCRKF